MFGLQRISCWVAEILSYGDNKKESARKALLTNVSLTHVLTIKSQVVKLPLKLIGT